MIKRTTRRAAALSIAALLATLSTASAEEPATQPASPLSFVVQDIDGKQVDLSQYKGKVVVIVNVASKCGHTKQYAPLEAMYQQHKDDGLVILGFPANNFGGQEPGSEEQIKEFCESKYKITFPMFSKISVKGSDKAPLYKFLTEPETAKSYAGEVGWNFTKFVIGRDGQIAARFESGVQPTDPKFTGLIQLLLAAK
ncbi:MAG TPA: glutathione peroxidase [Tepidisphaeraceae bacterium]|jgi:glutathione peroxidase